MKVLIACEESQEVCKAFRLFGHEAYSCDVQEPSGGHPEWHILGDAVPALRGGQIVTMDDKGHYIDAWDLLIAHPPCTYLSNAGARHLWKGHQLQEDRVMKGILGRDLLRKPSVYSTAGSRRQTALQNGKPLSAASTTFRTPRQSASRSSAAICCRGSTRLQPRGAGRFSGRSREHTST